MENNKKTKISYEPEADVLTYEITNQSIDYAQEVGDIVVHFTKNNMPVLVEILEASKFLKKAEKLTSKTGNLSIASA